MLISTILFAFIVSGYASAKSCLNFTVPINVTAETVTFGNLATIETFVDATTFAQNLTRLGGDLAAFTPTGTGNVSGVFNISAQYCVPSFENASNISTIQVLTHGIGFDRGYWDIPYNNFNYSYVDNALSHGYAVFFYDRLGIGRSSHAANSTETRDMIQTSVEIEALHQLSLMIRNGTMPNINQTFDNVVHVGHSFGSAQSYALAAMYPEVTNGLVLTGFSMNGSGVSSFASGAGSHLANLNQPLRFGSPNVRQLLTYGINTLGLANLLAGIDTTATEPYNFPNGYLINSDAGTQQYLFMHAPNFDPNILFFAESVKQPVTQGEFLTLGNLPKVNAFEGPVLVQTAEFDLPYCGGNCYATGTEMKSIPEGVKAFFPNASTVDVVIQPETGHGLVVHYNATAGFEVVAGWLEANGLAA